MKKTLAILAIVAPALVSSCKNDKIEPKATYKVKTLGDLKEHTGWDRNDSTGTEDLGSASLSRTAAPASKSTSSTPTAKKPKKTK